MAYEYIKRMYEFQPVVGATVKHQETGKIGVITRENKSAGHYVQVRFSGVQHSMPCHPRALIYYQAKD